MALCQYLYDNAGFMKILIKNNKDVEISKLLSASPQVNAAMAEYLEKRFQMDEIDLAVSFIYSGGYSLIRKWIMEDIPMTPEEIADLILRLATSGWGKN